MRAAHVGEVSDMAVRLEKQDAIGHIILDRPPANSYDGEFMEELNAAINGHCLGGGLEIALCCDFRIAAEGGYKIGLPEVTLGLLPGTGGTQRLPRLIGRQKALELMLRGVTLSPQAAKDAGIVDELVPAAELQAIAVERARSYAEGPSYAVGQIKVVTVQGYGRSL